MNDQSLPRVVEHTIRLASQWDLERLPPIDGPVIDGPVIDEPTKSQRLKHVTDYLQAIGTDEAGVASGRIRLSRGFGRPSGLTTGQRVELVVEPWPPAGVSILLNGQPLSPPTSNQPPTPTARSQQTRYDISANLKPRNKLIIELAIPDAVAGQATYLGQMRLEILRDN